MTDRPEREAAGARHSHSGREQIICVTWDERGRGFMWGVSRGLNLKKNAIYKKGRRLWRTVFQD